ncbi:Neuroendocrine convertase 2 [Fukomys damarensis]|uniref:Neuroendocrine convertase 2 n=1 Tax=Fukomys damarensis TaxID=885580 RepID=A0A091DD71_FUKDA|nr:Neuroendocrine convertase 2 [Fukomys damarensis]
MKGGCGSQWQAAAGLLFCVMVSASAERPIFTNHFLVELHKGGEEEARQVAAEHGFGVRKLPFTEGLYHFYHNGLSKAKRRRSLQHKQQLDRDPRSFELKSVVKNVAYAPLLGVLPNHQVSLGSPPVRSEQPAPVHTPAGQTRSQSYSSPGLRNYAGKSKAESLFPQCGNAERGSRWQKNVNWFSKATAVPARPSSDMNQHLSAVSTIHPDTLEVQSCPTESLVLGFLSVCALHL